MPDPVDDAAFITAAVMFEPYCLACIHTKTSIPLARIRRALVRIARHFTVSQGPGECAGCGRRTIVVKAGPEPGVTGG